MYTKANGRSSVGNFPLDISPPRHFPANPNHKANPNPNHNTNPIPTNATPNSNRNQAG